MKKYILLVIIVLFGGFLRFYHLDTNPPSLNWDEVSFGYNAYSILTTGRDEYGTFFPMYLRSFDDYKRPVYTYLTVASVALLGLTDFAVRFPSAFIGTMTILVVYGLTKLLFKNEWIAFISTALFATVPWHAELSRFASEATMGIFFTCLGMYTFLLALRKNMWWLVIASLAFGLSMYSYLSQRIVVPLLLVTLCLLFYRKFLENVQTKRHTRIPIVIAIICIGLFFVGLALDARTPEGSIRFQATSVFSNSPEYEHMFQEIRDDAHLKINLLRRIFHDHSITTSAGLVARGYLVHFSPDFLFFDIAAYDHKIPGVGLLYIWMMPFILIGGYFLIKNFSYTTKMPIFIWLFVGPIAAAVTWQVPHATRAFEMVIPFQMLIGVGIYYAFLAIKKRRKTFILSLIVFLFVIAVSFIYFVHQYSVHLPIERSQEWIYGRKDMVAYATSHASLYKKIIVSTNIERPYIYFLYYMKYDPIKYLAQGGTKSGGWAEEGDHFDKYEFHHFDYLKDRKAGNYLFIGKPTDFPINWIPPVTIYYLDGTPAIYIAGS